MRYTTNFVHSEYMMYEAEHVRVCLVQGLKESPLVPLSESVAVGEIMEECQRQVGARIWGE